MLSGATLMRRIRLNDSSVPATILVRYGELALKSPPVRREFEHRLERNIVDMFLHQRLSCRIRADHGHLYVMADDPGSSVALLRRVFGVTSVSSVVEVPIDPLQIQSALLELGEPRLAPGRRFAIRARRTGSHPFTSQQLAAQLGAAILAKWPDRNLVVDLDAPEVELAVEVRGPRTYLSVDRQEGPGGLPHGVAGSVVALVDGPRGALGAYMMMKRGCRLALLSRPGGTAYVEGTLRLFDPKIVIENFAGPETETQARLQGLADRVHADAVVLPLVVDEFPQARQDWGERVVFSPTVGLSEEEVEERWKQVEGLAGI